MKVRGKACCIFLNSKIVMSTLLPRKDFHPHTIQKVNISVSRDCQQWPSVHVVHHPSFAVQVLYDDVHISKERFHWSLRHWKMSHWTEQDLRGPTNSMLRRVVEIPMSKSWMFCRLWTIILSPLSKWSVFKPNDISANPWRLLKKQI